MPAPTKIRLHRESLETSSKRLVLPSPEDFGLETSRPAVSSGPPGPSAPARRPLTIDWNLTHQRLKYMGAVGFHLDHPKPGQVSITFWLPTTEPGRTWPGFASFRRAEQRQRLHR